MHHNEKIDAPSGTALMLGHAAAAGRGIDSTQHSARGRDGITGARKPGDIGFASLRGGTVVGDHSVIFAGPAERLELTHRAEDRTMFAHGALQGGAVGARQEARALFDGRRARACAISRIGRNGKQDNERPSSCAGASRPERMESEEPFTGWKDPDLTEHGVTEAKRSRPQAEGAGLRLRRRLHLGADARAAHARSDARASSARPACP